jgi:hypothetical protein
MKKADISVGTEYYVAHGRSYVYGEQRVRVDAIGAHSNSYRNSTWNAQSRLEYRTKVDAWRNDEDLSPNQVKANIAALDVEVEQLAKKLWTPFTVDGKGSGLLCTVLDKNTGEPELTWKDGVQTDKPIVKLIETRDVRCTWAAHVKAQQENAEYRARQAAEERKRNAQKAAEQAVLTAALPEGIEAKVDGYPSEGTIAFDRRPFGRSSEEVVMSRATLAKLLGVTLPEPEEGD